MASYCNIGKVVLSMKPKEAWGHGSCVGGLDKHPMLVVEVWPETLSGGGMDHGLTPSVVEVWTTA